MGKLVDRFGEAAASAPPKPRKLRMPSCAPAAVSISYGRGHLPLQFPDLDQAIADAMRRAGDDAVAVIPEDPYVVPVLADAS